MIRGAILFALAGVAFGQAPAAVTGAIEIVRKAKNDGAADHSGAVVWLKPVQGTAVPKPGSFEIRQQHKRFEPHVLVIPIGSQVAFPNADPFLHNVFSLHDGKRFDLGLYESGSSRTVKFDRPGVCFLFCNIHPEMSAVVMVLDTPYFAVSDKAGRYAIADVPGGRYMVNIWHERARPENPREFPHEVSISPVAPRLARIRLVDSGQLIPPHKNKYGKDYETPSGATYK